MCIPVSILICVIIIISSRELSRSREANSYSASQSRS